MKVELTKYKTSDEVDFVIVGSGAAGGIMAKELSTNGFRVVVLEQGPYLTEADFIHDEVKVIGEDLLTNKPKLQPTSFRKTPNEKAKPQRALVYGRCVGGTLRSRRRQPLRSAALQALPHAAAPCEGFWRNF